jgi:ferredoxin-like protein FixX
VDEKTWLEATEDGCYNCGTDLYICHEANIVWENMIINGDLSVDVPYCLECSEAYFGGASSKTGR